MGYGKLRGKKVKRKLGMRVFDYGNGCFGHDWELKFRILKDRMGRVDIQWKKECLLKRRGVVLILSTRLLVIQLPQNYKLEKLLRRWLFIIMKLPMLRTGIWNASPKVILVRLQKLWMQKKRTATTIEANVDPLDEKK